MFACSEEILRSELKGALDSDAIPVVEESAQSDVVRALLSMRPQCKEGAI